MDAFVKGNGLTYLTVSLLPKLGLFIVELTELYMWPLAIACINTKPLVTVNLTSPFAMSIALWTVTRLLQ